ncbi:hypothetical protein NDU88_002361 [Pleurodeles waltl]|uniref:Uncharacterized protein n=1 Tax=Pleurodeles waltl TaxID=8319 RepID=A0AAV7REA2_PLEWA|nr:hypothetical protein NDU88_002361 [Pleurodeles waltl]
MCSRRRINWWVQDLGRWVHPTCLTSDAGDIEPSQCCRDSGVSIGLYHCIHRFVGCGQQHFHPTPEKAESNITKNSHRQAELS